MYAETDYFAVRNSGVTDYCNQVCGGGNCGTGDVCQYGIDSQTKMPKLDDRIAETVIGANPDEFDAIEIQGVREVIDPEDASKNLIEVDNAKPEFYSVYSHRKTGGVECVGDHGTYELAVQYANELANKYGWPIRDYSGKPTGSQSMN